MSSKSSASYLSDRKTLPHFLSRDLPEGCSLSVAVCVCVRETDSEGERGKQYRARSQQC